MKKIGIFVGLVGILFVLMSPVLTFAQSGGSGGNGSGGSGGQTTTTSTTGGPDTYKIENPINVDSISGLVEKVLGIIIKIGVPVISLAIIYSGFLFISARGNPHKLEEAKSRFVYTLVGAGILLGAWLIATIIEATVTALMS